MIAKSCPRTIAIAGALLAAGALANCAERPRTLFAEPQDTRANVYPENYKSELLAFLRTYLNDPTGVREASIADPAMKSVGATERYVVCVRFTAKAGDGRYTDRKDAIAVFRGGRFDQFAERAKEQCSQAEFKPFPELEKLAR
jgi:hypothetical protein